MQDRPLPTPRLTRRASAVLLTALAVHGAGDRLACQTVGVIATGVSGSTVSSQANWRRSVAMAPDGTLWAVVRDLATDGTGQLYLRSSTDGGATWTGRYDLPTGKRVAELMEPLNLMWLEEPVPAENVEAYRKVSTLTRGSRRPPRANVARTTRLLQPPGRRVRPLSMANACVRKFWRWRARSLARLPKS